MKYSTADDPVNHPKHYTSGKYECIDLMLATFGRKAVMDFCRLNAFKYRFRAPLKGGEQDLRKAEWYENKLMELRGKGHDVRTA